MVGSLLTFNLSVSYAFFVVIEFFQRICLTSFGICEHVP
jgi:hypothetical protein